MITRKEKQSREFITLLPHLSVTEFIGVAQLLGVELWEKQNEDAELKATFTKVASELKNNETKIVAELVSKGNPIDIKGYYHPSSEAITAAMRPSVTFNGIIDAI